MEQDRHQDTPGEAAARDALNVSRELVLLRAEVRDAVARGIAEALTSEENARHFWLVGLSVLQREASERTGQIIGGVLGNLLKKIFFVAILVALIYSLGGWAALVGGLKMMIPGAVK